ncbi:MAG TPA: apolipoprotein N-acyltransferase [Candidatus Binataceae bacterium]|nr:apolipoprotein N-acyltransferase [Candidatus Binataceae bacterium]
MLLSSQTKSRLALTVSSGLALALAFPKVDLNLMAWVAFIPLLYAVNDLRLKSVFGYAWLQGLVFNLASLYWVVITLHNFTSVSLVVAVMPCFLLSAVLALDVAASFLVGEYVARRLRIPLFVSMPIAWTAFEWIRTYVPIGFPWNLLGYAAYRNLALIQFSEFTGVYGVSALIMFFNTVVFSVLLARRPRRNEMWGLSVLTAMMIAAVVFGTIRIETIENRPVAGSLKVAMVQANIAQSVKWNPQALPTNFQIYSEQSEAAARQHVDLIIWPEAAATFFFQPDDRYPVSLAEDAEYRARLLALARQTGDPILFGAPALELDHRPIATFNRAYLVSGQGQVLSHYDKMQLVPFGEYVPMSAVLSYFVDRIVVGFGQFVPGREHTVFDVKGVKLAVLICYESVFPDLTRNAVAAGADILVNITNDAWYGDSSAPYQLLAMSAMRSVETHTPMIRVANTGISTVITPTGAITARTELFTRETEIETVKWSVGRTVYTMVGDVFAEVCFALAVVGVLWARIRPRKQKPLEAVVATLMAANGHM